MRLNGTVIALVMAVSTACVADTAAPTPIPTQVLILPTVTVTPVIPTATPTQPPPPGPADVVTGIPPDLAALETDLERQVAQSALDDFTRTTNAPRADVYVAAVTPILRRESTAVCGPLLETGAMRAYPGFRALLTFNAVVYEYRTDANNEVRLCSEMPVEAVTGEILTLVDSIAAEMLALSQRRLSQQFDLPTRRIRLVDMQAIEWPDSSLGCPVAGQTYEPMTIDGYRLVLAVGDEEYIFHTDFDRSTPCAPENEVLP